MSKVTWTVSEARTEAPRLRAALDIVSREIRPEDEEAFAAFLRAIRATNPNGVGRTEHGTS